MNLGISDDDSRQIEITRVICIALMMKSHWSIVVNPESFSTLPGQIFSVTHRITEIISLSSVAALSLISGYLLFAVRPPTFGLSLARRLRTIYIPFLFWNFFFIGSVLLRCAVTDHITVVCQTSFWPLQSWPWTYVFGLFGPPAGIHLGFLRDLLISTALLIFAAPLVRRYPGFTFFGVGLFCVFVGTTVVLHRPEILLCMVLGAWIVFAGRDLAQCSQTFPALMIGVPCVLFYVFSDVFVEDLGAVYKRLHMVSLRVGLAMTFIWLSWNIAQKAFSRHIEPYSRDIFFVYLAHYSLLNLFILPVMNRLNLRGDIIIEGAMIFVLPVISVLVLHHLGARIDWLPARLQLLLRGRTKTRPPHVTG